MDVSDLSNYGRVFEVLGGNPGRVVLTVVWTLGAAIYLTFIGTWLPLLTLRNSSERASNGDPDTWPPRANGTLTLLALAMGGGMILTVALGTLAAFVVADLLPGVAAAGVIGLVTTLCLLWRMRRAGWRWDWDGRLFAVVTGLPLVLGLWIHAITEFPSHDGAGQEVVFADYYGDMPFHVFVASVLQEAGLPLRDLHGNPEHAYAPVTHTGHAVLIASLSTVLGVSLFSAATALWNLALVVIAWSAAVLLLRHGVSRGMVVLGSVAPLVLGPLAAPSFDPLSFPAFVIVHEPLVAARMYWNISQALSTGLAAIALILFDGYCREPQRSRERFVLIGLTALTVAVSGWVKPSLFIFYGPALIVTLLVHRAGLRDVLHAGAMLAAGVIVYMLPAWLVPVPEVPPWSLHPSVEQTAEVASFVVFGCSAVLLLSVQPLRRLFRDIVHKSEPRPETLALVAMGGSVLFALLFREEQFVGFRTFQPNIWWGASACAVLLLPLVLAAAAKPHAGSAPTNWFLVSATAVGAVQVFNGVVFAIAFSAVYVHGYPASCADAMRAAREVTSADTRFLLDPAVSHADLAPLLARPALFHTAFMPAGDRENLEAWSGLFEDPPVSEARGWTDYDAALLHNSSTAAQHALNSLGWTSRELTDDFQLWTRPDATARMNDPP